MDQIQDIKQAVEIYQNGLISLIGNSTEWFNFLKFSAKFYKYKFHENLLLYSQDKNITACATYEEWKKVGRYPKQFSKSLKTIYSKNGKLYLKSVFDLKDTNGKYDIEFKLWETTPSQLSNILSRETNIPLEETTNGLHELLAVYISNIVENVDFLEDLELPYEQVYNDSFLNVFIESMASVILSRCNIIYEPDLRNFEKITDFQTFKKLGYAVNKYSYELLKIIELDAKENLKKQELEELSYETNNISEYEQNVTRNEASEISRPSNGGNNKRDTGSERNRNSESSRHNRRTIKSKISKTRYGRIYSSSSLRKYGKKYENGTNKRYDTRKSKRNLKYDKGVVQTTLFDLPKVDEELKNQTPTQSTFAGYKVGDLVYLDEYEPQYIRNIDIEKNQILVSMNPYTDVVLQKFSIPDFEKLFYEHKENHKLIEENKNSDIHKLEEITDINPLTEEETAPPPPPIPTLYRISDDLKQDSVGIKKKFEENIAAIKLLKQLEQDDREATDEERNILAKYNGWGGLSKAFEEESEQLSELERLLSPDELVSCRESALTSFYTEPYIIDFMYKAVQRFGINKKCKILDPSSGVGNFIGRLPTEFEGSKITAIEKDNLSGRMLKKIYPSANVHVKGYEDTNLNNNYFDLAISNIPFGEFGVFDRNYDNSLKIHDYFFEKTLDKVKPGGIIAFVTSRFTLDKKDSKVREYISNKANFLGAVRLPSTAFKKIANTEAISDIIFLQKKGKELEDDKKWLETTELKDGIQINSYFYSKKYMIKGKIDFTTNQFGETLDIVSNEDLREQLEETINMLPSDVVDSQIFNESYTEEAGNAIPVTSEYANIKDYTYTEIDGKIYYRINDFLYEQDKNKTVTERIKGLIKIRTALRELIEIQNKDVQDHEIYPSQTKLNRIYDEFVKKYGYISSKGNELAFKNDTEYPLLISLEKYDKETKEYLKTDIFRKRTIKPYKEITHTENAREALIASINQRGKVDLKYIMKLSAKDYDEVLEELKGLIYHNPELAKNSMDEDYNGWETVDQYLSRKCC